MASQSARFRAPPLGFLPQGLFEPPGIGQLHRGPGMTAACAFPSTPAPELHRPAVDRQGTIGFTGGTAETSHVRNWNRAVGRATESPSDTPPAQTPRPAVAPQTG